MKHRTKRLLRWNAPQKAMLGILCSLLAFTIGMESAGKVHPFESSKAALDEVTVEEAAPDFLRGDFNGNGVIDIRDAIETLEVALGLEEATVEQIRRGDTNGDFHLTGEDSLSILRTFSR